MNFLIANTCIAALLALIVLAIGRALKPAPAVMHGLWLLVLLKLATPPLFELPLPSWPTAQPAPTTTTTATNTHTATARPLPAPTAAPALGPDDVVTVHELPRHAPSGEWLLPLWLCSTALVLLWQLARCVLAARRQRPSLRALPSWLRAEVDELARRIEVRAPAAADQQDGTTPFVRAFPGTLLVLPAAALARCNRAARTAVLAHELGHLKRRDHWTARLELLLQAALWWHPMFWLCRARMRQWAELSCDAIALRASPGTSIDYARLLVDAVDQPEPYPTTGPAIAALAWRPTRRADFERRLQMILNDSLLRRASRAWCVPFAGLTLGLFTLPATAQQPSPEPPARVEIRINGEPVQNLSREQRARLLEVLGDRGASQAKPRGNKLAKRAAALRRHKDGKQTASQDAAPELAELQDAVRQGLAEARAEIRADEDLRALGLTDDVTRLLDDIEAGRGIDAALPGLIDKAMQGVGAMVEKELAADEDLRSLGLDKGLAGLLRGMLANGPMRKQIGKMAEQAIEQAIGEARAELRQDPELAELGIAADVDALLEGVVHGGGESLEAAITKITEKAMQHAEKQAAREAATHDHKPANAPELERAERELERARARLEQAEAELERAMRSKAKTRRQTRVR